MTIAVAGAVACMKSGCPENVAGRAQPCQTVFMVIQTNEHQIAKLHMKAYIVYI